MDESYEARVGAGGAGMGAGRRALLRRASLFAAGAGVGAAGFAELANVADRKLPLRPSPAGATDSRRGPHPGRGQLLVTWAVETDQKLAALTFDDGWRPEWTTLVLDTLQRYGVPATFFMVGRRVRKYPEVLRGRMGRHEIGNHTWDHLDLARRTPDEAYADLLRAHEAIVDVTGQTPRLARPPYGHMGGSAALAAARLDYQVVFWSLQMVESRYPNDPLGHARFVVEHTEPGGILLAHDIGAADRLVALRGLPEMITGLRARGFELVTVSQLMSVRRAPPDIYG
ncbi:MAG TPA: polysaccharide deacetylase family protein [Micromonosporaceae bacterium]|nr:polysaccharide deacetylase family protein [Micromonosporaceae bacterium]